VLYNKYLGQELYIEENFNTEKWTNHSLTYKIRNNIPECELRIGSFVMMIKKNSKVLEKILNVCFERYEMPILEDYDIMYTVGPDIVSTIFNNEEKLTLVSKTESNYYFCHMCVGHWTTRNIV